MDEIILTKEARSLLRSLLKVYRKRLRSGVPPADAANFNCSEEIHKSILPEWSFDAVDTACAELLQHGLGNGFRADGVVYRFRLSAKGIAFIESASEKTASSFLGWAWEILKAIQDLLPW